MLELESRVTSARMMLELNSDSPVGCGRGKPQIRGNTTSYVPPPLTLTLPCATASQRRLGGRGVKVSFA